MMTQSRENETLNRRSSSMNNTKLRRTPSSSAAVTDSNPNSPTLSRRSSSGRSFGTSATPTKQSPQQKPAGVSSDLSSIIAQAPAPRPMTMRDDESVLSDSDRRSSNLSSKFSKKIGRWNVDPQRLEEWKQLETNNSPFDSSLFYPILPAQPAKKAGKMLLCLDIDETMVHASTQRPSPTSPLVHHTFKINSETNQSATVYIACRPGLTEFIREVTALFEVVIFTASQSAYANPLIKCIDPDGLFGGQLLCRQHCAEVDGTRVKDLNLLGRPLDRVAILDNSPFAYLFQPRNAIPIESWFDNPNDTALQDVMPLLRELAEANKVYDVLDPYNCSAEVNAGDQHSAMVKVVKQGIPKHKK